jgi:bacterioferritin
MSIKGGKEIIEALNEVLEGELAAINQYFLHAKMCQNWGLMRMYGKMRAESIDEMKHADQLIDRILYLDGLPNVQRIGRVHIGENVPEMLQADKELEEAAIPRLNRAIELCRAAGDNGTRMLLESILASEEEHLDWLEAQIELLGRVGTQNYLAEQIKD